MPSNAIVTTLKYNNNNDNNNENKNDETSITNTDIIISIETSASESLNNKSNSTTNQDSLISTNKSSAINITPTSSTSDLTSPIFSIDQSEKKSSQIKRSNSINEITTNASTSTNNNSISSSSTSPPGSASSLSRSSSLKNYASIVGPAKIKTNASLSTQSAEEKNHERISYEFTNNNKNINRNSRLISNNKTKSKSPIAHNSNATTKVNKKTTLDTYDDLLKQFEQLKQKAELFAEKDPAFTSRLINFAKKITQQQQQNRQIKTNTTFKKFTNKPTTKTNKMMDNSFFTGSGGAYSHTNYTSVGMPNQSQQSSSAASQSQGIYSPHSSYHHHSHHPHQQHHHHSASIYSAFSGFYKTTTPQQSNIPAPPTNPPPPPPPRPPPIPPHTSSHRQFTQAKNQYRYDHSGGFGRYPYTTTTTGTPSSYNTATNPATNRHSTNSTPQPNGNNSGYNNIYSHYYPHFQHSAAGGGLNNNVNATGNGVNDKNSFSYSYSYNTQEGPEDILLILEDPFESNKITVQMTRTQIGPNGEQQRVTVERDFKNETDLNKFLKDFETNLNKSSSNRPTKSTTQTATGSSSSHSHSPNKSRSHDDLMKTPGVVVVEEPGEEPKLYRQDTGELVTDMNVDPFLVGENNEHPNHLPKGKENAKSTTAKMYKDIDELIEKLKNDDKSEHNNTSNTNTTSNTTANSNATINNKSNLNQHLNINKKSSEQSKNQNETNSNNTNNNRLSREDKGAPQTPNTNRKSVQNQSFVPFTNDKDFIEKLANDQIPLTNNNNNMKFASHVEKELSKSKTSNDKPNNVLNPSPISINNTKGTTDPNSISADTFSSAKKLLDDLKLNKNNNSPNNKLSSEAIINSNINEAVKLISSNSSRKSETAKISKECFVTKSRPRSSSTKVKKSQDHNVSNNNNNNASTSKPNRSSMDKPGIKKVIIHSHNKSTPFTNTNQSNNINKEIKTHLQNEANSGVKNNPSSFISHTIAASLPAIPPLSAKAYVPNNGAASTTKNNHHRHNHTTITSAKDSLSTQQQQIINNGKEKKVDLSSISKAMRHKLPETKQQDASGNKTTKSLKEDFLNYSRGEPRVSFQPNTQFTSRQSNNYNHQSKQQQHSHMDETIIKRHASLFSKGYLPRSESILQYDKTVTSTRSEIDTSSLSMFEKSSLKPPASVSGIEGKDGKIIMDAPPMSSPSPQPITDPILTHIKMKPKASIQMREKKSAKIDAAKHRFSQVYERYNNHGQQNNHHLSNSDCSTIGELKSMTKSVTVKKTTFKESLTGSKNPNPSNLSRNISKSVDTGLHDSKLIKMNTTAPSNTVAKNNNRKNLDGNRSNSKKLVNGRSNSDQKKTDFQSGKIYFEMSDDEDEDDFDEDIDDDDDDDDDEFTGEEEEEDDEDDEDKNETSGVNVINYKRFENSNDQKQKNRISYEFFNYDFGDSSGKSSSTQVAIDPKSIYADPSQFYGSNFSYRAHQNSPACFQPGFFPTRTATTTPSNVTTTSTTTNSAAMRSRMTPQPEQQLQQQGINLHNHLHHNHHHHHAAATTTAPSYFSRNHFGYYASWYGSAPSLRMSSNRHHRQSLFLS